MVVDFTSLSRAFNYLKGFAAYNMVIVHYYGMLGSVMTINHFLSPFQWLSLFRGFFSLCLPWFAGYYLRAQVGPFLQGKRLSSSFIQKGLVFFIVTFILEIIRLFLIFFHFNFSFNWNPLHFIGLSFFFTYLILSIDKRLLFPVTLTIIGISFLVQENFITPSWDVSALKDSIYPSYLWSALFSFLVTLTLTVLIKILVRRKHILLSILPCLLGLILFFGMQKIIVQDPKNLEAFLYLPHDVFFPNLERNNYWAFFSFYPIFAAGYFMRSMWSLRKMQFKRDLIIASSFFIIYSFYFLIYKLDIYNQLIGGNHIFTRALFSMKVGLVIGIISFFNCIFVLTYFLVKRFHPLLLDRWAYYSRSVILLYIIHTFVIRIVIFFLPEKQLITPTVVNVILLVIPPHLCYIFSLAISHFSMSFLESLSPVLNHKRLKGLYEL